MPLHQSHIAPSLGHLFPLIDDEFDRFELTTELEETLREMGADLRLANERLHLEADERRRLEAARQALQDDLIRSWSDGFGQAAVAEEARAFFARLRLDRW